MSAVVRPKFSTMSVDDENMIGKSCFFNHAFANFYFVPFMNIYDKIEYYVSKIVRIVQDCRVDSEIF